MKPLIGKALQDWVSVSEVLFNGCGAGAIWKAPHFLAVGVGEGGACRWWGMGGAASFAKCWSWLAARCRPHHFRFFTNNHSRPSAATVTIMMEMSEVLLTGAVLAIGAGVATEGWVFGGGKGGRLGRPLFLGVLGLAAS